jgi:hypothetical protein
MLIVVVILLAITTYTSGYLIAVVRSEASEIKQTLDKILEQVRTQSHKR